MKTIIIIGILAVIVFYSLRSVVKYLKGEKNCCAGCPSAKSGGQCCCSHKKII